MTEKLRTWGEIRRGDVMVDRNGGRWLVGRVERVDRLGMTRVSIMRDVSYAGPESSAAKVMERPSTTPVTIDRAEEPDDTDYVMDALDNLSASASSGVPLSIPSEVDAVQTVKGELGGQVLAVVTDAQEASFERAVETGEVLRMPPFSSYSMMSARSHLFLLHNLIASDGDTRADLNRLHDEVTASPVQGPPVPAHEHEETK